MVLLEEELQKQDYDEDSGTDSPPPGEEQQDSPRDGTRQSRGHRRRRLLPSNVSPAMFCTSPWQGPQCFVQVPSKDLNMLWIFVFNDLR
jgi:hypothetical protein